MKRCYYILFMGVISASLFQGVAEALYAQRWFKIFIENEGIYKITSSDLSDAGIDPSTIDPKRIQMYYGGGKELPWDVNDDRPLFSEIPIHLEGEGDGTFDAEDYILFYGSSLSRWEYDPETHEHIFFQNRYTNTNVYWLTVHHSQAGLRMKPIDGTPLHPNPLKPPAFRTRTHGEKDHYTSHPQGCDWYWYRFGGETAHFDVNLPAAITDSTTTVQLKVKGDSRGEHNIEVYLNGILLCNSRFFNKQIHYIEVSGRDWVRKGQNVLNIAHTSTEEYGEILVDWFELEYWRHFEMDGSELEFFGTRDEGIAEYRLAGFNNNDIHIFDVSDPYNAAKIVNMSLHDTVIFQDDLSSDEEKRYYALSQNKFKGSLSITEDQAADLRNISPGANYIIIADDEFYEDVMPLKYHREWYDGLSVEVVRLSDVYDEFAWGLSDPTAIRDFLKYVWDNRSSPPSYTLLVGDGHYDYRNNLLTSPPNRIPPHEDEKDCGDDWFVSFDDDRGPEMSIGRLPAQSREDVRTIVDKIVSYDSSPFHGPWRNTVLLLADDACHYGQEVTWETVFTTDSEQLNNTCIPSTFDREKVYSIEYGTDEDSTKARATVDLIGKINLGALIVNYVGHGMSKGLAHEKLLHTSLHMDLIDNTCKPCFFFLAACDAGMFDIPTYQCFAEQLLSLENKGAIGVIAATRPTFASPNYDFNSGFYSGLFRQTDQSDRLGDIIAAAKQYGSPTVNRMYVLLGDPAQRLHLPQYEVNITSISPESLMALSYISVEGEIQRGGSLWSEFNGNVYLRAFGPVDSITHVTSSGVKIPYVMPGSYLYRGSQEVRQGRFSATFLVPENLKRGNATGRISAYAWNDEADAAGAIDSIYVGGERMLAFADTVGPSIDLTVEEDFTAADQIPRTVTVVVTLWDECGINLTGDTLHALSIWTDSDSADHIHVTDFFEYESGSCTKGALSYRLPGMEIGLHTVYMRAWDNANNASQESMKVMITPYEVSTDYLPRAFVLSQNYPNPFNFETTIEYQVPHSGRLTVAVYNVLGQRIKTLADRFHEPGYYSMRWNGTNDLGVQVASGVFFSRMESDHVLETKKMIFLK